MSGLRCRLVIFVFTVVGSTVLAQAPLAEGFNSEDFVVETPSLFISGLEQTVILQCLNPEKLVPYGNELAIVVNGRQVKAVFQSAVSSIPVTFDRKEPLSIKIDRFVHVETVNPMPLWWSVVPPLLVIILALVFREVLGALASGIFAGAVIAGYYMGGASGMVGGFFSAMDVYLVDAFYDRGHISVIVFSTVIGGIVAIISKNGGMSAVVHSFSKKAKTARSGQMATWLLGIAIFFDDYANTLVVGNTMRPLTDRLRISREKLAYIVDSTAAPVAAIALITTWIGAELGYIEGAINTIQMQGGTVLGMSAYAVFIHSLQYAFYPIFTLIFILIIILTGRDFGPMYKAEIGSRNEAGHERHDADQNFGEEFSPVSGAPLRMINAFLPIGILVLGTIAGLLITGYDTETWSNTTYSFGKKLSITVGNSDSYKALLWASISGLMLAVLITTSQRIMTYGKTVEVALQGFKTMIGAVVILALAWALAAITQQMHTADYLAGLAGDNVAPWAVPALTFIIAGIVSFSTGSAWGTMAIVYPLMLPLSWELSMSAGLDAQTALPLFFNATSAVLAGAVLGDHCSPISDTTILSSLASRCDHIEHVRTQMPYAITVGAIAIVFTISSALFSVPWYINFPLGIAMMVLVVRLLGRRVEALT